MQNVIIFQDTLRGVFLLSTTTEWLLAFSIMVYVLTFIPGFKRLRDIKVKVTVDKGGGEKSGAIPNGDQVYFAYHNNHSCESSLTSHHAKFAFRTNAHCLLGDI